MAIFSYFWHFLPGSYRAKNPGFGQKWPKSPKPSKISDSGDRPRGVLHQPLAPAPRGFPGSEKRDSPPGADKGLPGDPSGTPPGPRIPGIPARYRGAPARGVDVKPPSRGRRGDPSGSPGAREPCPGASPGGGAQRSGDPGPPDPGIPGILGSRGPLRTLSRGPRGSQPPLEGLM